MGYKIYWLVSVAIFMAPLTSFAATGSDEVVIKKLRTHQEVVDQYCYVQTGGTVGEDCGAYSWEDKVDVVYAPKSFGERVMKHLESAYKKNYFQHINKQDLFHGHFIAKGPQTFYDTPAAWFDDMQMILYHAEEYLNVWTDLLPGDEIYTEHKVERSFVGWIAGDETEATAAINLIPPTVQLSNSYLIAGSISEAELNESLHISQNTAGKFQIIKWSTNTCAAGEANCEPCEIFNMMYLMADPNGRFTSPDGVRMEVFFHCKYKF